MGRPITGPCCARPGIPVDLLGGRSTGPLAQTLADQGVVLTGTAAEIAGQMREFWDAGVDEVVLNPVGVLVREGVRAALRDVVEVTDAPAPGRARAGR